MSFVCVVYNKELF